MKAFLIIFFYYFIFIGISNSIYAQKLDSIKPKSLDIKEEFTLTKKRKYTYFVSDRLSDDNKYDVFKITPTNLSPTAIVVRGHSEVIGNPSLKKLKILVYNASNNELVGIYNTNKYTGNYILVLVPNVKYIFKVETTGYGTLSEIVEVPLKIDYEVCKQDLIIKLNDKKKPNLTLTNFFEDEDEKVYVLKSTIDSTGLSTANSIFTQQKNNKNNPKEKITSTIDALVKKQVIEENKKPAEALKAFNANDFETASVLYSALLKNDPQDPFANYYYGASLLKLNRSIAKAINSLQIAVATKDIPIDVYLYLGKAYHLSYIFQDALIALEDYKKRASPTEIQKNNVTQLINNCKSGATLITEQVNIEILKRTPILEENLLATYNTELINDRLKYKTDFFKSAIDKKKLNKQLLCTFNNNEYIHISYGEKETNSTDLFKNITMPNGTISASQNIGAAINTPYDENYPYITKDGNTLYFSSKGHNSMGGFDIFKCTRANSASAWSAPENMGFPINSTYDDILFIPDSLGEFAWMCSNRKNNRLEYIHLKLPKGITEHSVVKGSFSTTDSVPSHDAIITVYNFSTKEIAGVYKTNSQSGKYLMILTAGVKYEMMVESIGYPEMSTVFDIPKKKGDFVLKQVIKFQKDAFKKSLKVNNYFTETEAANVTLDIVAPSLAVNNANLDALKTKDKKPVRTKNETQKDQEDLHLAQQLTQQTNYNEAIIIYQGLEQYINLEAPDLYNYGICLFNIKKDKSTCIKALTIAAANKTTPIDVFYYLAKATYLSYKFSDAIKLYTKFKTLAKPADVEKLNVDKEIECCNNCIKYVNNPTVLEVYEKKHVDVLTMQNSFANIESGGKVLIITDDFRSSIDKKKNFKSLIFLTPDKNTIFYSSYGEDENNGKDIYRLNKLSSGKWCPTPQNISAINTNLDEEYPCLSKDGKTLYFSSKGYDNMGGYDVFKSTWDDKLNDWAKPISMGAPINSPYEDIYFLE